MKKLLIATLLSFTMIASFLSPTYAADSNSFSAASEADTDYCYVETVITDSTPDSPFDLIGAAPNATTKSTTKTKTSYVKNAAGEVLWYVSITATFTYDGSTANCTSCSHKAAAPVNEWKIKSVSSSKSGNSATAIADAIHIGTMGISQEYTQAVTIQCSPSGVVS